MRPHGDGRRPALGGITAELRGHAAQGRLR